MINKLKKPIKMQEGGIGRLPMPPSSPNVPAVYNQSPFFSVKGLQQRYAGLPGFIRKPANLIGRTILPKNPYVRAVMYGIPAFTAAGGIEGIKEKLNPTAQTVIDRMNQANQPASKTMSLQDLGISPLVDAQEKLATDITEVADGSVPLMPGTDVLSGSVINKIKDDSGIQLPPDGGNIVQQADANDGFLVTPEPERPKEDTTEEIDEKASDPQFDEGDSLSGVVDVSEEVIDKELTNRNDQQIKSDQNYWTKYLPSVINSGRSQEALLLDAQVRDIMGPESKRSKNLLLLQLAANLISGRTDQPGFKGFLDVLGKAGQQTIPMAIALEEQRREDERELKKALINARGKQSKPFKRGKVEGLAIFLDENGEKRKGPLRYDESNNAIVTVTDPNGKNPREVIVNGRIIETMKFPEPKQKQEIINEIRMYSRALNGSREVLDIITKDPTITGAPGTIKRTVLRAKDIFDAYAGNLDFSELRTELNLNRQHFMDNIAANKSTYGEGEYEKVIKAANEFFDKQTKIINEGEQTGSKTLEQQAKIRSIQLFTSYALANILKNKDRLAVQDIKRAEEITENFRLLGSPTDIIFAYKELADQLEEALKDKIEFADSIGVSDTAINKLRYEIEGDTVKRQRLDKSLDEFINQALDGYTSIEDLLNKLNFDQLQIIESQNQDMGAQSG